MKVLFSIFRFEETSSLWEETVFLWQDRHSLCAKADIVPAARETLSVWQEGHCLCGKRDIVSVSRETLSLWQERHCICGKRDIGNEDEIVDISYVREYFIVDDIRMTIDKNINYRLINLNKNYKKIFFEEKSYVLELKTDINNFKWLFVLGYI